MQANSNHPLAEPDCSPRTQLAEGGFSGDTEIMTTTGPVAVSELTVEDTVLALNPTTRILKPKDVVQVKTVHDIEEVIAIETRRGDFRLAPDHRFCYTTEANENPQFTCTVDLMQWYQRRFVNEWRPRSGARLIEVDITDFVDDYEMCASSNERNSTVLSSLPDGCEPQRRNSFKGCYFDPETFKAYQSKIESVADEVAIHAGHNSRFRPYRFEADDFIEFLGWFVTEGSVTWRKQSNTATIRISQKDSEYRPRITALFERMGIKVSVQKAGFDFSSTVFGTLLEQFCGTNSFTKRLQSFIWDVSSDQKRLLLDTLMQGDGNDFNTYYTASGGLAGDVLRLMLEQGMKPRYTRRDGLWEIFMSSNVDGFASQRNLSLEDNEEPLYRITIQDFSLVMAGRNGKFQWVSVSDVA